MKTSIVKMMVLLETSGEPGLQERVIQHYLHRLLATPPDHLLSEVRRSIKEEKLLRALCSASAVIEDQK